MKTLEDMLLDVIREDMRAAHGTDAEITDYDILMNCVDIQTLPQIPEQRDPFRRQAG
jgi:hypothetical protein